MRLLLLISLLLIPSVGLTALQFPGALDAKDRQEVLRVLGAGTSIKHLSTPYPLGGYSGIEIGYSIEFIPVDELKEMGDRKTSTENVSYSKISLGKGIYNNIDIMVEFMPYGTAHEFSEYGALVRWTAFESDEVPMSLTTFLHGSSSNFNNELVTQNFGYGALLAIHKNDVSAYLGGGRLQIGGEFVGSDPNPGITETGVTEEAFATMAYGFLGFSYRINDAFVAVETNRYQNTVTSLKFGVRF